MNPAGSTNVLWWVMDRREHHRVQLRLPARLRWTTPFGQKTEICETLNVSRGGLLVPCKEPHASGFPLWVTFPYDPQLPEPQPEILARVIPRRYLQISLFEELMHDTGEESSLGLCFHADYRAHSNGNGHKHPIERRASRRRPLAVPVRVRPQHIPWFEEAMTMDISSEGLRFLSRREYAPGQPLFVSFEAFASAPWPGSGEFLSQVVRVEPVAQSPALAVTVTRVP